jgi:hypothetical protein
MILPFEMSSVCFRSEGPAINSPVRKGGEDKVPFFTGADRIG